MSANITNEIVDMPDPSTLLPCRRETEGGLCGEKRNKSGKHDKSLPWEEIHSDFCDYQEVRGGGHGARSEATKRCEYYAFSARGGEERGAAKSEPREERSDGSA